MIFLMTLLVLTAEFYWVIHTSYAPTIDQLNLGIHSFFMLWVLRITSLTTLILSAYFISKTLNVKSKKFFWLFLTLCPGLTLVWLAYPLDAFKIFVTTSALFVGYKLIGKRSWTFILSAIVLLATSLIIYKESPPILNALSVKKAQEEVTFRINVEDNTKPNIPLPLVIRRISYNKYFFVLKNTIQESINFFDIETLFFEDIHPLGQKSFPVFFWPQIILLGISIYNLSRRGNENNIHKSWLIVFIAISFLYFLTSSGSPERRHLFNTFTISALLAQSISFAFEHSTIKSKALITFLLILTLYGWATNLYDRSIRPDFWLDNRPIAYDYVFNVIKSKKLVIFDKIKIPDTLYATSKYCELYIKDCTKFESDNFILYEKLPSKGVLYIGYTGNFLGLERKDADLKEITAELESKNMKIYGIKHILNNIASGYGQELIIAGVSQ